MVYSESKWNIIQNMYTSLIIIVYSESKRKMMQYMYLSILDSNGV